MDRIHRPELMQGTVEFLVPKEYWNKEPVGLRWLFLLDVSQEAVSRGFLEACCDGLLSALYGADSDGEEPENTEDGESKPRRNLPEGSKIGIITFDKEVHFYNLSVCDLGSLALSDNKISKLILITIAAFRTGTNDCYAGFAGPVRSFKRGIIC